MNELDKLANGLEQYNAAMNAALEKKNDTQPLVEEQPSELWKSFQKAKEAWEASLRKRLEEDAKLLDYQVHEEAVYQAYDKPIASNDWWQKEQARLLAAAKWEESFGSGYPDEKRAYLEKWGPIAEQQAKQPEQEAGKDALGMMQEAYEHIHVHGPFAFLMNQNHNALRGCVTCGATWVGMMAGLEENIRWHSVQEPPEEEEG